MLQKFSAEDAAVAGSSARIPEWAMKMPGIGSKALVRTISLVYYRGHADEGDPLFSMS